MAEQEENGEVPLIPLPFGGAQQPSALVTKTGRVVVSSPPSWLPNRVEVPLDTDRFTLSSGIDVAVEVLENGEAVMLWKVDRSRPAPPPATLRLLALGRRRASLQQIGGSVELSPRHSEILTLLVLPVMFQQWTGRVARPAEAPEPELPPDAAPAGS